MSFIRKLGYYYTHWICTAGSDVDVVLQWSACRCLDVLSRSVCFKVRLSSSVSKCDHIPCTCDARLALGRIPWLAAAPTVTRNIEIHPDILPAIADSRGPILTLDIRIYSRIFCDDEDICV